jgi:hypothetical protein
MQRFKSKNNSGYGDSAGDIDDHIYTFLPFGIVYFNTGSIFTLSAR